MRIPTLKADDHIPLENEMTTVYDHAYELTYAVPWWAVLEWHSDSPYWWLFTCEPIWFQEMRATTMLEF